MSSESENSSRKIPVASLRWLIGLFLLHLPYIGFELLGLWRREHYQFYPFAFIAFGILFYKRALPDSFQWHWFIKASIAVDLLLLAGGIFLSSSYLVYVGAMILLFACCRSVADRHSNSSLAYLMLLPAITIRLPLGGDLQAIQWLQRVTTAVASLFLNFLNYLHVRSGNVLDFPGKRFLVEEACSGVQSLYTVLFLAALIACVQRRTLFHALLLMASAACFAGVMNVLRVASISIAWSAYQLDLSVGWQHDMIGYIALLCAAGLVFSADAAIEFACSPVPDLPGAGSGAMFWNPLTFLWNRLFLVMPRAVVDPSEENPSLESSQIKPGTAGFGENLELRAFPSLSDLIRPGNLISWIWNFVESWFLSRPYPRLTTALPFLCVGIGGMSLILWLRATPQTSLVRSYEKATKDALQVGDFDRADVYLRALVQLRPKDHSYRFRLAIQQLEQDQATSGLAHLEYLAGPAGYTPARTWLVMQTESANPVVELTSEQIEGQLKAILKSDSTNAVANRIMAQRAMQNGQLKLAEDYLLNAVDKHPKLSLPLVKLQRALKRDPSRISHQLDIAESESLASLLRDPTDVQARIRRAETLLMRNRFKDAERILKEGGMLSESPELRSALATLYSGLAAMRLKDSALNAELATTLVLKSLELQPENPAFLRQAISLQSIGVVYNQQELLPAIKAIAALPDPQPETQILLAQAMAAIGEFDDAIDQIRPLLTSNPRLRLLQTRCLLAAGRRDEADSKVNEILNEQPVDGDSFGPTEICDRAEALLLTQRSEEAVRLLKASDISSQPELALRQQRLSCRANLAMFDERLKTDSFHNSEQPIELLNSAWATRQLRMEIIERLAELSCSESQYASDADVRLMQILVQGKVNADVYNLVGSKALAADDMGRAKRYLERAVSLAPDNPMVLNNLAVALVRDRSNTKDHPDQVARALRLANEALTVIPNHPDVLSTRAEILVDQQRWEEARRDLEIALQRRKENVSIRRLLVQVFNALGEPNLAAEHNRALKELNGRLKQKNHG